MMCLTANCFTNFRVPEAGGYFVNMVKTVDISDKHFSYVGKFSMEQCDERCLQIDECVMFNYYFENSTCSFSKSDFAKHMPSDSVTERHIVRCNPALGELPFLKINLV